MLVASCLALVATDLVFWRLLQRGDRVATQRFDFLVADPVLGVRHVVSATYHAEMLTKNGDVVYRAAYAFDEFGRRVTVSDGTPKSRSALFFGCSFVEGAGLGDNDTLPSQVAVRASRYQVLNYSIGGSGPQQMLVQLRQRDFSAERVPDPAALGVYVFLDFHVERAIGSMQVVTTYGRDFPYFALDADGTLRDRGTFTTGRPVRSFVYSVLNRSHAVRYALGSVADWPPRSAEEYRTTAAIVAESKAAFLARFPKGRFVAVIYPGTPQPSIRPWLTRRGIELLDLSDLFDPNAPGLFIPIDRHPSAAANARLAAAIVERLGL